MITMLLVLLVGAKVPTIEELAKTERGFALPCGVEEELDTVPSLAEVKDMKRWARQEHDSSELEATWTQLRVRRALREALNKDALNDLAPDMTCDEFLTLYRIAWDRAAQRADKLYGSSRKSMTLEQILRSGQFTVSEPHEVQYDSTGNRR